MLKVTSKLNGIKMEYEIETKNSSRIEFIGAIDLILNKLYKIDSKIKNDKDFMKFLKEFRKMSTDLMENK